jgi:hypothetical protein
MAVDKNLKSLPAECPRGLSPYQKLCVYGTFYLRTRGMLHQRVERKFRPSVGLDATFILFGCSYCEGFSGPSEPWKWILD